jgi:two-component system, chemotaxis family, response regulator Rcp1
LLNALDYMNSQQRLTIMILEDNRADVLLLKEALHKAEMEFIPIIFADGESAFRYIDEAGTEIKPLPDLAILDLNVPKRDGSEVLAQIRRHSAWRQIPVVIFSSSTKRVMLDRAAQADCYITKPAELAEFLQIGEEIRNCVEAVRATRTLLSTMEIAGRQQLDDLLTCSEPATASVEKHVIARSRQKGD